MKKERTIKYLYVACCISVGYGLLCVEDFSKYKEITYVNLTIYLVLDF